jgi:hypothetical protein
MLEDVELRPGEADDLERERNKVVILEGETQDNEVSPGSVGKIG